MKFFYKSLLVVCILCQTINSLAQTDNPIVGIGKWRMHLPYTKGIAVTGNNDKIYCATNFGMFSYSKADGAIQRYSRINGLSDLELSTIRYSPDDHLLLVAYQTSNIDLIYDDNTIVNIPYMKLANVVGGKTINHILFANHYAYLSCSFGIVVLDLVRQEVHDTYKIGPNGTQLNVNALAYDGTKFYAATAKGIYTANANDPNLFNYADWSLDTRLDTTQIYNSIVANAGKIFTTQASTTKYYYDGTQWGIFPPAPDTYSGSYFDIQNNVLMLSNGFSVSAYNSSLQTTAYVDQSGYSDAAPFRGFMDSNNIFWIADSNNGLVKTQGTSYETITPNTPAGIGAFAMASGKKDIWVASGQLVGTSGGNDPKGVYLFSDNYWKNFYQKTDPIYNGLWGKNVINIAVDPKNDKHAFVGGRETGLYEYGENGIVKVWDNSNSPILPISFATSVTWIGGVDYDSDGNLWVVSNLNSKLLDEYKTDGTWKSFNIGSQYSGNYIFNLLVDRYNQKWVNPRGAGLIVYKENDPDNPNDDNSKLLTSVPGQGGLPSLGIFAMVQDKDGAIWLGTDQGVSVIYNPGNVFSGGGYDAQQILIMQDGHAQYLLETDYVLSIAVDGANRKWFGTLNGGVFLMSADGTKQLLNFNVDNSPLLSNQIWSIAIDKNTGEVFFGTDNGICSYRGDATEGGDACNDYYVFPNPVKHDYYGPIAIKGLVANASVKISDLSGQLVYQTKANGGEAIWNGNNFKGERAKTGVYLVYVTNADGTETCVTKMLFTN